MRIVLRENVVSDDYIEKVGDSRYELHYFTYANEWCDKEHTIIGTDLDDMLDRYEQVKGFDDEQDMDRDMVYICMENV